MDLRSTVGPVGRWPARVALPPYGSSLSTSVSHLIHFCTVRSAPASFFETRTKSISTRSWTGCRTGRDRHCYEVPRTNGSNCSPMPLRWKVLHLGLREVPKVRAPDPLQQWGPGSCGTGSKPSCNTRGWSLRGRRLAQPILAVQVQLTRPVTGSPVVAEASS